MSDTLRVNNLFTTAIAYSTLTGSTITTNSLALSTLTVSSINSGAPGVAAYSTFNASSINTSSITTSSIITAPGYNSNIGNVLYTSLADSGQTAANMTTSGMPGTAPAGSVISGTYRLTAGASSGAAVMRLSSFTYTAGTTYNFTFTGMQGSQSLVLYVYQYNAAGTASIQISSNVYSITTSAATVSGSFTANLYPATYTGTIVFYFQAGAVNQYVNFTTFSMTSGSMNVGIGTTNASSILDVRPVGTGDAPSYGISHYFPPTYSASVYANQLVASLRLKWYNDLWDISGIRGGNTSWQSLAIRYNGTEFLTVGASGNVGIGSTGPGYTLDVAGYARATSGLLAGNGTAAVSLQLFDIPAAAWQITTGGNNLSINNNSASWTNRLTINQTGQVGIGTAPSAKLHIFETATNVIRMQTSASDSAYIVSTYDYVFLSANYTAAGVRDNVGRGSAQIVLSQPTAGGTITFNTSPSVNSDVQERMRILANGNVGIGITNHIYPFSVAGTIQAINVANDTMGLFSTTYGGYLHIGSWTASGGGSKNIVMQQMGGYVGIGTNAPTQPLHIYQATSSSWSGRLVAGGSTNVFIAGEYNGVVNCGGHNFALNQWTNVISGSAWSFTNSISKAGGTFDIGHPLYPNTSKRLVHSFIEGPRCDLIYRGKTTLVNGTAVVDINKECTHSPECAMDDGTFEALCANPQIFLQNNQSFDRVRGTVAGCILTITSENSVSNVVIEWMVIAERVDSFIKKWDRTNPDGYLITQYTKGTDVVAPPYV